MNHGSLGLVWLFDVWTDFHAGAPVLGRALERADALGLARVAERLSALAQSVDPRFAPSPQILELAKKNGTFYAHDGAHNGVQEA